jgi:hypothetical protein
MMVYREEMAAVLCSRDLAGDVRIEGLVQEMLLRLSGKFTVA